MRAHPSTIWSAQRAFPPAGAAFAELRRRRSQPAAPQLAVVTAGGDIDPGHPALVAGAIVLTTDHGAAALRSRLPRACSVVPVGTGDVVDPSAVVRALRERGHRLVVSEAGPRLFGSLLAAGLVDELFLTRSPLLAGRGGSLGLVEGFPLLPDVRRPARLLSVRRAGDQLFLRYGLRLP